MIDAGITGKTVLITGGNHGIGAATARALAAQGARTFITCYRTATQYAQAELDAAEELSVGGDALYRARQQRPADGIVDEIRSQGGNAAGCEVDLADAENIADLFDACEDQIGPVDILVNNHAHCVLETFDPARESEENGIALPTPASVDAHFVVNARACALLMTEYLRRYLARGAGCGRIINVSTDAAHAHGANVSYAASKHAIESYSRSAAGEMGRYGITANIVAPGPIQTGWITPEAEAEVAAATPLRRVGSPEDVADVVVFLASKQARWVTGQLIYVGGGYRMHQ